MPKDVVIKLQQDWTRQVSRSRDIALPSYGPSGINTCIPHTMYVLYSTYVGAVYYWMNAYYRIRSRSRPRSRWGEFEIGQRLPNSSTCQVMLSS